MLINWTHHEDNDADEGDTDRYAGGGDILCRTFSHVTLMATLCTNDVGNVLQISETLTNSTQYRTLI